jgi:hypothetical protein
MGRKVRVNKQKRDTHKKKWKMKNENHQFDLYHLPESIIYFFFVRNNKDKTEKKGKEKKIFCLIKKKFTRKKIQIVTFFSQMLPRVRRLYREVLWKVIKSHQ